jgi:hypothetical protein
VVSAAVAAATKPLPRPRAIDGAVSNDVANRTLIVSRPSHISGYEAFSWRQAHEQLVNADERAWSNTYQEWVRDNVPVLWCSTPEKRNVVKGAPGPNLELHFHFPAGTEAGKVYTELVGKPGLAAIVTVDRGTLYFLGVKFLHRP